MNRREVIGVMNCPECGFSGAEIKLQKNGFAYRWCCECNAQYFSRTPETSERLLEKIGRGAPVLIPAQNAEKKPALPVTGTVAANDEKILPERKTGMAGALELLGVR